MVVEVLKYNNLALSYEKLNENGKVIKSSQKFAFIPDDATPQDLFDIGNLLKGVLANSVKELTHNLSYMIMEG